MNLKICVVIFVTRDGTVDFARLEGLLLVLPRRPSQWRAVLDETARSKGFALQTEVEADSLRAQKELVAHSPGLYSVLGSFSMAEEMRSGGLQAARIVNPELRRYVTLACDGGFPRNRHGLGDTHQLNPIDSSPTRCNAICRRHTPASIISP